MRSRFFRMAVLMLLLAIGTTAAVMATWFHFVGAPRPAWLWWILPIALTASFIPNLILGFRLRHPLLRATTTLSAIAIGFLSFALAAAALSWLLAGVAFAAHLHIDLRLATACLYTAALAVAGYGLINAVIPRTAQLSVSLPNLPEAWRGKTVALVTDIHLGNIRGATFSRHLVRRLRRHHPEAVFISGDMFDGTEIDARRAVAPWSELKPPAGIYFVSGNHDDRHNRSEHLAAIEAVPIRVLNNERVTVRGLQIVGIHDAETHRPALYQRLLADTGIDRASPAILLAHQPVNLAVPEAAGIALQLAGHTHGGQFWPWVLIARRVHGKFVYGLNRFGRMQIYTSSGAGTWGPTFRVGTHSEIVLLRLEQSPP